MKIELEGHLYIVKNYYDQYEVDELCLDKYMSNISYENLDSNSHWHLIYPHLTYPYGSHKNDQSTSSKIEMKSPSYLIEIIKDKISLEVAEDKRNDDDTYTFMPKTKKVKITIEEID